MASPSTLLGLATSNFDISIIQQHYGRVAQEPARIACRLRQHLNQQSKQRASVLIPPKKVTQKGNHKKENETNQLGLCV
jgi:hypothetical protein